MNYILEYYYLNGKLSYTCLFQANSDSRKDPIFFIDIGLSNTQGKIKINQKIQPDEDTDEPPQRFKSIDNRLKWKLVAMVLDRCLLILLTVVTVSVCGGIFILQPTKLSVEIN